MKLRNSYYFIAVLTFGGLGWLAACQDQGKNFSYGQLSGDSFVGAKTESDYDALLQKYVDSKSFVRYGAWLKDSADLGKLKSVLEAIANTDEKPLSTDQRKALYINAYNALTLDLILSHFDETKGSDGVRSIKNIGNLGNSVWDHFKWRVTGQMRTLNDIEHKILRPMGDARIHFAIVCASVGCPPIHNHAFKAETLNATLDQLADQFVNSGRSTTFDQARGEINTSKILDWFGGDFKKHFGSLSSFFERYVKVIPAEDVKKYSIRFSEYDWSLNESQAEPEPTPSPTPDPGSGTENPPPGSGTEFGLDQ